MFDISRGVWLVLFAVGVSAACGGGDTAAVDSPDGDAPTTDGGTSSADGGAAPSDASTSDATTVTDAEADAFEPSDAGADALDPGDASADAIDPSDAADAADAVDAADAADAGPTLVAAETVATGPVLIGQTIPVTCLVRDDKDATSAPPAGATPTVTFTPPTAVSVAPDGVATALVAGSVQITCSFPSLSLTDATPASVTIAPMPTLTCDGPTDGAMVNATPGAVVTFSGSVTDPNGVSSVTVNGATVTPAAGAISAPITTRFGTNFVDVVATNSLGGVT